MKSLTIRLGVTAPVGHSIWLTSADQVLVLRSALLNNSRRQGRAGRAALLAVPYLTLGASGSIRVGRSGRYSIALATPARIILGSVAPQAPASVRTLCLSGAGVRERRISRRPQSQSSRAFTIREPSLAAAPDWLVCIRARSEDHPPA